MKTIAITLLAALPLALCSCGKSHGHTVVFSSPGLQEIEPNNNAFQPDAIGPVAYDTYYQIHGAIQDGFVLNDYASPNGTDQFDGFAFYVEDAVEIEFILHANNPFADLDVWIYDPFYDEYIAKFESISSPEYGRVTFPYLGEEFHVVVTSYSGDSNYTLELIAHPLVGGFSSAVAAATTEQPTSDKKQAHMQRYLKARQAPESKLVPVKLVQVDRESGEVQVLQAVHDGKRLQVVDASKSDQ